MAPFAPLAFAWAGLLAQAGDVALPSTDWPVAAPAQPSASVAVAPAAGPAHGPSPTDTPVGPCYDPPSTGDREEEWANRTMKGHTFLYPTLLDTSFVASYIGVRAGVNSGRCRTWWSGRAAST